MGVVLEAEHLRLRQQCAIKFLNPEMMGIAEIVERFEREARAAATLRSRHVVRVSDVEATADGVPYMVMELLVGHDLESERELRARLPYPEAVDYVLQACSALAEAHDAGIVHRDLKPANLFLAHEDDRVLVKILDFGISKFLKGEDAKLTSAGAIMGTALYMSPEQIRGAAAVDARSDIWALGVILYELIGGSAPWLGPTTRVAAAIVSEPAPDLRQLAAVPEALAATIHQMLEKDPARRPPSIPDLVFALAPYAQPGSVGSEVAEQLARRSSRGLVPPSPISTPRTSTPSSPHTVAMNPPPSSSDPVPSSRNPASSPGSQSERIRLIVSAEATAERSTMAATTSSMSPLRTGGGGGAAARPRKLVGAFVALPVLAAIGIGLVVLSRQPPSTPTVTNATQATPDPTPPPPLPPAAVALPDPPPTMTVATPATTAPPHPTPPASSAKKPASGVGTAPSHTAATAHTPVGSKPPDNPVINPPFLK